MKIAFVSNYINHHQLPFCDAMHQLLGNDFIFLQTEEMEEERLRMGWDIDGEKRSYVRMLWKEESVLRLIKECDILLTGWYDNEKVSEMVLRRVKQNKPTFRISERIYRSGRWKAISPRGLVHKYKEHTRFHQNKYYLLCAGAYVAGDFNLIHAYPDKKFKWGYFPSFIEYGEELWQKKREKAVIHICWAGRFMPLKHPDYMIRLAKDLRDAGYHFHLDMIGSGNQMDALKKMTADLCIEEWITFHGFKAHKEVRKMMEESHIFVFTSDYREGWGAVMNEAMNSGCALVASAEAGGSGYLIEDGKNGFVYHRNQYKKMRKLVINLMENPGLRDQVGRNAYQTIFKLWNAKRAANELIRVCRDVLQGKDIVPAAKGPLSATK